MIANTISSIRILVVDDTSLARKIHRAALSKVGYQVEEANDGQQAVDMLSRGFDIIFMDINMPVMDGVTATQEIRRLGSTIPIIGITGCTEESDINGYLAAGMNEVIVKPATIEELSRLVQKWCSLA